MRKIASLFTVGILLFGLLQLVRPGIPAKPAAAEIQASRAVRQVLEKSCYSCHSDQRRLAWFDQIVPGYWLVRQDVLSAREHLNFSTIGAKPIAVQRAALYEAVNMIQLGTMPLASFKKLHPEANVSAEELGVLKTYLAPWTSLPDKPANAMSGSPSPANLPVSLTAVQPELNGLPFDGTFETWKPISTTDRGDNNTLRFILANDVALNAVKSGNMTPWPDGSRLAKVAWQQERGEDGLIHPGKFIQVELMIKDAKAYKHDEGWGWGRWRGLELKPYGHDAHFVGECTTCHLPVKGNDYVYTLPISTAKVSRVEVVNNRAAALPSGLPYQPLGWGAITMYVDPSTQTSATLYGNDTAIGSLHTRKPGAIASQQPGNGAVIALVTWAQREDPHWFGARIPDRPLFVEFLAWTSSRSTNYTRYDGAGKLTVPANSEATAQRTNFLLSLKPAPLP